MGDALIPVGVDKKDDMLRVQARLEMDLLHKVECLSELGMTDPFHYKASAAKGKSMVEGLDFYTALYPRAVMEAILEAIAQKRGARSKCIFVPEKEVMRLMIRAVARYGKLELPDFLLRFGLYDRTQTN